MSLIRRVIKRFKRETQVSETSKCRSSLALFCQGDGVDVGFGGDPIVSHAICMDMPQSYAKYENNVQHLHGDARNLRWFVDGSLDWVYSSHVLEDFENTNSVLQEWLRVLRPGGHLILFLPDEQLYRAHCAVQGKAPNPYHVHSHFSLDYLKNCLESHDDVEIIHERYPVGVYSFEVVIRKK